jgi:hypothetical protein
MQKNFMASLAVKNLVRHYRPPLIYCYRTCPGNSSPIATHPF